MAKAPEQVTLRSADNRFQHLLVLKENRNKRHRYQECFIEGVKPIKAALREEWTLSAVVREAGRPLSGWAEGVCRSPQVQQVITLPSDLMRQLSDRAEGSELVATARIKEATLDAVAAAPDLLVLVLDKPSSPGNLGTLIRSAQSFGASAVVVCGHAADVWDPVCIRASIGTVFSLQPIVVGSSRTIAAWLKRVRTRVPIQVIGTDSRGSIPLSSIELVRPTVLLIGNEATGLSPSFRDLADVVARIPMVDDADSLNAAVAASIALYEARRQRADKRPESPD